MLNIGLQFFAHKKGGGSTKNGRASNAKRLGPQRADGIGSDDTLYAKESGVLRFERLGKDRKQASVYPAE